MDYQSKAVIYVLIVIALQGKIDGRRAHNRDEIESRRAINLANRELKASKTSIVAYNKTQIVGDDVDKEAERIEAKCTQLGSPCHVVKLKSIGVFEVEWEATSHPLTDDLELDPEKEFGAEDSVVTIFDTLPPTDPLYSDQWAYDVTQADINIEQGWTEYLSDSIGGDANGPSVIVAVSDTGIEYTHPDLVNRMWTNPGEIADNGVDDDGNGIIDDYYGADFTETTSGTGDPIDRHLHGTHCAGIIAAEENNGEGVAGVASFTQGKVKLMAIKGLDDTGSGTQSGLLAGMNYAIEHGARISSNSWGSSSNNADGYESLWDQILQNNPEHLMISAAGNDGLEIYDDYRPRSCGYQEPNLLCVASSKKDGTKSGFSNYGENYVHVFAPGNSIYSTVLDGGYAAYSGTSMATPMVSGLAALIMTMREDLTGAEVRALIEANVETSDDLAGLVSSGGLIDVGATIVAAKDYTGEDTTVVTDTGDKYYVDDGCQTEGIGNEGATPDDVTGFYQSEFSTAYVRCCADWTDSCLTVSNCRDTSELRTFAEAEAECEYNEYRLCTKDELLTEKCCGTGGGCDSYAVWTSTIYEEPSYYVDDGCHSEGSTPDDYTGFYQPESSDAFVRCCSDDGSTCATISNCRDSNDLVNYADAEAECATNGMRLCTMDELLTDICCGTGGQCDSELVWTSTASTGSK